MHSKNKLLENVTNLFDKKFIRQTKGGVSALNLYGFVHTFQLRQTTTTTPSTQMNCGNVMGKVSSVCLIYHNGKTALFFLYPPQSPVHHKVKAVSSTCFISSFSIFFCHLSKLLWILMCILSLTVSLTLCSEHANIFHMNVTISMTNDKNECSHGAPNELGIMMTGKMCIKCVCRHFFAFVDWQ